MDDKKNYSAELKKGIFLDEVDKEFLNLDDKTACKIEELPERRDENTWDKI